jgi:hypothetical protein
MAYLEGAPLQSTCVVSPSKLHALALLVSADNINRLFLRTRLDGLFGRCSTAVYMCVVLPSKLHALALLVPAGNINRLFLRTRHEDVWGSGGIAPPLLKSALDGRRWSPSHSGRSTPEERVPVTHWTADWVGLRTDLDAVEKIQTSCPCLESNPRRLTRRCTNSAIVAFHSTFVLV